MERKRLILGLDPGTTWGYALLDLSGTVIETKSSKGIGMSQILRAVTEKGKILAVATDKKTVPFQVSKMAASLGARVLKPSFDLSQEEKRILTREYDFADSHQKDALAAAIYAFKLFKPKLQSVEVYVQKLSNSQPAGEIEDVKHMQVKHDPVGMSNASSFSTNARPMPREGEQENKQNRSEGNATKLPVGQEQNSQLARMKKEINLLRDSNERMRSKLAKLEKSHNPVSATSNIKQKHASSLSVSNKAQAYRENRIKSLSNLLENKNVEIDILKKNLVKMEEFIGNIGSNVLALRLKNLSFDEISQKIGKIKDDSQIIVVDDLSIISNRVIGMLQGKIRYIVSRPARENRLLQSHGIGILDKSLIRSTDFGIFSILDRSDVQKAISKQEILDRVVKEYKADRIRAI